MIELTQTKLPRETLPTLPSPTCPPDEYGLRFVVDRYTNDSVLWIMNLASELTQQHPTLGNNLFDEETCPSSEAKIVHSLAHIVTCRLAEEGDINLEEAVRGGDIAFTVPLIETETGKEGAIIWFRDGLVPFERVETVLANFIAST